MARPSPTTLERDLAVVNGKLQVLHQREADMQALLDSIRAERLSLEAEREVLETQHIPANWLPTELLIHIFLLCVEDPLNSHHATGIDRVPVAISHVCRKWRAIALDIPRLWHRIVLKSIDVNCGELTATSSEVFFERSKGAPLNVLYAAGSQTSSVVPEPDVPLILDRFPSISGLCVQAPRAFIVRISLFLKRGGKEFPHLETLDLSSDAIARPPFSISPSPKTEDRPWRRTRFPNLHTITITNISLSFIPISLYPSLRELTLCVDPGSSAYPSIAQLARILACTPSLERLSLLGAGPIFDRSLDAQSAVDSWMDGAATTTTILGPVPLPFLRDLEWTNAHPECLHYLLTYFPMPSLEELDITFVDIDKHGVPMTGPNVLQVALHHSPTSPVALPSLRTLRAECTSSDGLRVPFLKLTFPALETLYIANTVLPIDSEGLPSLPRPESIFRDPRLAHVTHLHLTAFTLATEGAPAMLGYMPALTVLACDLVIGANLLLEALCSGPRRCCPRLRRIDLWECEDASFEVLVHVVKMRNGSGTAEQAAGQRLIRPLKRSVRAEAGREGGESTASVRIAHVKITGCKLIPEDRARTLEQWGVVVEWSAGTGVDSRVE
ncbi:hypothetical protein OF83DRAFT_40512 [Amylostereum chailletii]|nr:hypothetical protein OF83DRAFT_40512 [Amylostereum chailletii]